MPRYLPLPLAVVLFGCTSSLMAAKVKVWHHHAPSHYDKAQLKQAVVTNEGTVRLSRQLRPLAGLDASRVWDVVEDRDGNLLVATGDEGKLYRVTPQGTVSVVYSGEDSQILCLAAAPDGAVYAGTGPGGLILRIGPSEPPRVLYRTPESYVWCLAYDAGSEKLYAGTGPKGRIYQVTPDGKGDVFYATHQDHVLTLAPGPNQTLYAGTDKNGLVYRIDAKGKAFVVFQAHQAEIRALLVTPEAVYAGTSAPSRRRFGASSAGSDRLGGSNFSTATPTYSQTSRKPAGGGKRPVDDADESALTAHSSARDRDGSRGSATPSGTPPGVGENSVYRIAPDGSAREVFREKALVLSLLRQGSRLWVGTGMEGQLFEVSEPTRESSEIARLDHGQVSCLYRRRDGSVVVGTGDPGKLYVMQDRFAAAGSVVSDVLDAKIVSKWGALRWQADAPAGTAVSVAVRSGNVAEPDDTWSEWSPEQTDSQQAVAAAPAARFLQYRVKLATENPGVTPALKTLSVRYATTNQAPEVTGVDVPDLDAANLENPKRLRFKWSATDPNEDELTYSLYVRKDGWKNWVQLEEGLEKRDYEWDTTTTPSGVYQLKVVASDRRDNPAEEALEAERVSAPFVVAHTPPAVTVKVVGMDGDEAVVEATATDPWTRLTAASYAVNGKKWVSVFPTDGLFDSKSETFRFKTDVLKPGTYVLVLKVTDAAGNAGSADVVFTVHNRAAQR